ncbi:hypothetical protein [Amnibacterium sp.]|uniref:hypothetical protein n=1 Tax=Amnibacterium sp. TaxID=1872496 RepID=UPI003F7B83F1
MDADGPALDLAARQLVDAARRLRSAAAAPAIALPEVWATVDLLRRIGVELPAALDQLVLVVERADREHPGAADVRDALRRASDHCCWAGAALEQAGARLCERT